MTMKLSISASTSNRVQHLLNFPVTTLNITPFFPRKDKVVVVMGATGTGKSRLAIDLAARFPAEIINSDKMQVYQGLDVLTNKVTEQECRGIPHHLLGIVDPTHNFTAVDFQHHASSAVDSIINRDRLPIIAGGSNSYIDALVNDHGEFRLKFDCCFLWVDVSLPILRSFVSDRVDRMIKAGLIDEVRQIFNPENNDYSKGLRRAIGVPELDHYLRIEPVANEKMRTIFLQAAIAKIKENTCLLAYRQLEKIRRLHRRWDWNMHRIDATEVFLKNGDEADEAWENLVANQSSMIVENFLYNHNRVPGSIIPTTVPVSANTVAATSY